MFPFPPTKVFLTHNHIITDKKIIYKNKYKSSKNFISIKNKYKSFKYLIIAFI